MPTSPCEVVSRPGTLFEYFETGGGTGDMLFGPQIGSTTAEAGTYRVTLTIGDQSYEGTITIREDPLMAEHGGR